ncbi:hypothetical protein GDO86_001324, partial [Hymenochirus boettgeri]
MAKMTCVSQNQSTDNEVKRAQISSLEKEDHLFLSNSDFQYKLNIAKNELVEQAAKHNKELCVYENQFSKLRLQAEQREAIRQNLEYELAVAKKECRIVKMALEEEKANSARIESQFKVQIDELQQKMSNVENVFQTAQHCWQEAQETFESKLQNRDKIIQNCIKEQEDLAFEKSKLEILLQKEKMTMKEMNAKISKIESECNNYLEKIKYQKAELENVSDREKKLHLELQEADQKMKHLEKNVEAERAAHLESKFSSEVIQLRIQDLEESLQVQKASFAQTASDLDTMKKQFNEMEAAYYSERRRAEELDEKIKKCKQDFEVSLTKMKSEIVQKNRIITEMSGKQNDMENSCITMEQELAMAKKQQFSIEETHKETKRELQSLVGSFHMSRQSTSEVLSDRFSPANSAVLIDTLRHILTDYKTRLKDSTNKKSRSDLEVAEKELNILRTKCRDQEIQVSVLKMNLDNSRNGWEKERLRALECENEFRMVARDYQTDTKEKLTFLHSLYQSLVAGCVLIKKPAGMLDKFSWQELCIVLEENVAHLISDLNHTNDKVSHLEAICRTKTEVMKDLQQNYEDSLGKLAEEMKGKENRWLKERRDLEQHYILLLQEAESRSRKFQTIADKAKDTIAILEKTKDQMALENVHIKNLLINTEKDHKSLLAACALMVGALYPLYSRACLLRTQKHFLENQVNICLQVNNEIQMLVEMLSENEEKYPNAAKMSKKQCKGILRFRIAVIVVLAVNRLFHFGRSCTSLFTWRESSVIGTGILVCTGCTKDLKKIPSKQCEQMHYQEVLNWFTSSDLLAAVVSSMTELLGVLNKTDLESQSQSSVIQNAAKKSFSKLMKKLSNVMENETFYFKRTVSYADPDSLLCRLAVGFQRISNKHSDFKVANTSSVMKLCEAKLKLHKKDQYLHHMSRKLVQLEQDKHRLEDSIRDAENALGMAAKDQMSLASSTRNEFPLQLPKLHLEIFSAEELFGRPEFVACQNVVKHFTQVYDFACIRAASLEKEIECHRNHIEALKSELKTVCLRESLSL